MGSGADHRASARWISHRSTAPPIRRGPTTTTTPPRGTTSTVPRALGAGPATVYVLSDSVILGAQPQIQAALPAGR